MSRTLLSPQSLPEGGAVVSFVGADNANGNYYQNTERESILVKNSSGSSRTVTFKAQRTSVAVAGMGVLAAADIVLTLADGDVAKSPPLPAAIFSTPTGAVNIDISGTGISIAVTKAL